MTEETPPKIKFGRLWTATVRRAVLAPDVERYLARKNVDLLVTDQLEALQVRVRKGIEVMERKIDDGHRRARRYMGLEAICAGVAALANSWQMRPAARWLLLLVVAPLVIGLLLFFHDWLLLQRLRNRYPGAVEKARTLEELLQLAESALAEARVLGIVPAQN